MVSWLRWSIVFDKDYPFISDVYVRHASIWYSKWKRLPNTSRTEDQWLPQNCKCLHWEKCYYINQTRFVPYFVNYKKGCTRLAAASDKSYQLVAHGRWFSPGTSSTTKTGRHDKTEILLKPQSGVKHNKSSNQANVAE